jgi:hypothetical protein
MRGVLFLILLLIMSQSALGSTASPFFTQKESLLAAVADYLSGPVWLNLRGLDPIHTGKYYAEGSDMMQAPGVGGPIFIPYREPTPKFSRNVIVSYDLARYPYQAEPHIVSNPSNPDNLVVGLNDYSFFGTSAYASIDGGVSWQGPFAMKLLQGDDYLSDPTLAFDREGQVYYAYMSIGYRMLRTAKTVFVEEIASIVMSKSDDGGVTWSNPVVAARGDLYLAEGGRVAIVSFLDRPRMAVGPDPNDPSHDNIYITYTEFMLHYPLIDEYPYVSAPIIDITIKLVRSIDRGLSFSSPISISPTYSYPYGELYHRIVQGSRPAVDRSGKLYVAYFDSLDDGTWRGLFAPTITWSLDGGRSFVKPLAVDYLLEMDFALPPTPFRAWPSMSPQIEVGPKGEVYMVVAAKPPDKPWDDSDIYFFSSSDGGQTWSKRRKVNDDLSSRDQFFPAIAVSQNGTVHISFADRRDDPQDVRYHIYYTKSSDQGKTWIPNARVSDYPSNPNFGIPFYVGDYFTLTTGGEEVYIVWTDTRLGRAGSPSEKIAFARMQAVPAPSIFLSPPSGPAGVTVTLMGFNFAPRFREVYIEVDGVVVSTVLTNEEGRFTATLFMPISGQGPHTVRAIDISGNVAEATFYMDFGFGSIKDLLKHLEELENITRHLNDIERRMSDTDGVSLKETVSKSLLVILGSVVISALVSSGLTLLVYTRISRKKGGTRDE